MSRVDKLFQNGLLCLAVAFLIIGVGVPGYAYGQDSKTDKQAEKAKAEKAKAEKAKADKAKADKAKADKAKAEEAAKPASITSTIPPLDEELARIFAGDVPRGPEDLKKMEAHFRQLTKKIVPATVGVRVGASGSGVIISPDGYVLTAGHVSGRPGRRCTLILHDGRRVRGITLGANRSVDSGLIKITTEGEWPYVEMGDSQKLERGQWCVATGHPGGYREGRSPPLRVGRIQQVEAKSMVSDCTLVGGDSGGPLFDMRGRVIGIHSRISNSLAMNVHVPVNNYRNDWKRLSDSEVIEFAQRPVLGVRADLTAKSAKIADVTSDSAAEKAGIKAGDVIIKFDGKDVDSFDTLASLVVGKKPGDKVKITFKRGDKEIEVEVKLDGRRAE